MGQAVREEVLPGEAHLVHPEGAQVRPVERRVALEVGEREFVFLRSHPRREGTGRPRAVGVAEAERDVAPHRALRLAAFDEILAAVAEPPVRDLADGLCVERRTRPVVLQHGHRRLEDVAIAGVLVAWPARQEEGLRLEGRTGAQRDPFVVARGIVVLEGVAHRAVADRVEDPVLEAPVREAPEGAGALERRRVAVGGERREKRRFRFRKRAGRNRLAVVVEDPRFAVALEPARGDLAAEGVVAVDDAGDHPVGRREVGLGADGDLDRPRFVRRVGHADNAAEQPEIGRFDAGVTDLLRDGIARGAVDVATALFVDFNGCGRRVHAGNLAQSAGNVNEILLPTFVFWGNLTK